jgi:transposase
LSEFNAKQQVALCQLAAGATNAEAAAAAGVSLSCVEKWKARPDFQKSLKDAVSYVFDAAIAELVSGSRDAAKELKRIISDPNVSDRVKVSAIQTLFSTAEKCKQWQLEARLERVEGLLDAELTED